MPRRVPLLIFLLLVTQFAFPQVREKDTTSTREQEIRDLIEKFNLEYQQKDTQAISGMVSPDLRAFAGGRAFASWAEYRDEFLSTAFSRRLPASTWQIEKIATAPEMAWAYTKTTYTARLQKQPVEADLYQLFVLQKMPAQSNAATKSSSSAPADWKIVVIAYSFHREGLSQQAQPNPSQAGSQPK